MNKIKLYSAGLILSSLVGYLQWGQNNAVFLAEAETDVIFKLFTDPQSATHPFTVIPLFGQLLLLITLFQKDPGKLLTYCGMACIAFLLVFVLFIGLLTVNFKIVLSVMPFICLAVAEIMYLRKSKRSTTNS